MKNIEEIVNIKHCYGCGACEQACNAKAISMIADIEGFLQPSIDYSKCVSCGLCLKKCQANTSIELNKCDDGEHFICQSKDYRMAKKSASGGCFIEICKLMMSQFDTVVYGAAIGDDLHVEHRGINSTKEINLLQGSKYVQSKIGSSYKEIREHLNNGKHVFFSGTPCQVAGLYKYLGKDYDELVTADIICHGVTSPGLLKHYIECLSEKHGAIKEYKFRYKHPFFRSISRFLFIATTKKGRRIILKPSESPYYKLFLSGVAFRETCYTCPYAQKNRIGDFTIGDCDSHAHYPEFHPSESNSTLMVNSPKAHKLWYEGLKKRLDYQELDIDLEASRNKQLSHPFERPKLRDEVYQYYLSADLPAMIKGCASNQTRTQKFRLLVSIIVPPFVFKFKSILEKLIIWK